MKWNTSCVDRFFHCLKSFAMGTIFQALDCQYSYTFLIVVWLMFSFQNPNQSVTASVFGEGLGGK